MNRFIAAGLLCFCNLAFAQQHPLFKDADLAMGEKLIAENKCNECHIRNVGGRWQRHLQTQGSYQHSRLVTWHGGVLQHPT